MNFTCSGGSSRVFNSALNAEVESKAIDGYLWLSKKPEAPLEATFTSRESADFVRKDSMKDAIGHALVREELVKRGATSGEVGALLKDVDLRTLQVKNGKAVAADASKGFWGFPCSVAAATGLRSVAKNCR